MTDIDLDVPDELRSRLASAAKHFGMSEHDFILKAIAEKLARGVSVGEGDTSDLIADGRR